MNASLPKSIRFLAWFGIVNGILTVATPVVLPLLSEPLLPLSIIVFYVLLGGASAVSGFYGLKAKQWAFRLLFVTFLVQCGEYFSENFFLSLIGPLSLKFGWGWYSPPSHFNINILAIVVCVFAARAIIFLTPSSSTNVPSDNAASLG